MKIYIDQSGKVEDTAKPTVIAFTDGKSYAIKVKAKTKRQIQEIFRRKGLIRLFIYKIFGVLIFLLIYKFIDEIDEVVIDTEYPGNEKLIKDIILEFIRKKRLNEPTIIFQRIGNRPKVHYKAYNVYIGEEKEDSVVKLKEIVDIAIKNDRGLKRLKNA